MIFRVSFSVFYFILHARKRSIVPEGFVVETPSERTPTPLQRQPESPTFHSTLPTIFQSPPLSLASPVSETPSRPVVLIGNDSTETLVNVVAQPFHPKPILILNPSAHVDRQTRRISFADSVTTPCSVTPINVTSVDHIPCQPSAAAGGTLRHIENTRENVPEAGKISRRKSFVRTMSLLAPKGVYRRRAHRSS